MKRAGMVMQDVNYQLFAESVAAECVFGVKRPDSGAGGGNPCSSWGFRPCETDIRARFPADRSSGWPPRRRWSGGKELLVFDEPTSGLDYDSMARLAALIRRLAERGTGDLHRDPRL